MKSNQNRCIYFTPALQLSLNSSYFDKNSS